MGVLVVVVTVAVLVVAVLVVAVAVLVVAVLVVVVAVLAVAVLVVAVAAETKVLFHPTMLFSDSGVLSKPWEPENMPEDLHPS